MTHNLARTTRAAGAAALLAATALAQYPPYSTGPLLASPTVFSIDPATPLGTPGTREAESYLKSAGFTTMLPVATPAVGMDFRAAKLLGTCMGTSTKPFPDIDAISLGVEPIPVDCSGRLIVAAGHWNAMTFSVSRSTVGLPGSRIAFEAAGNGSAADIFSYVFLGSTCLPADQVGVVDRLADSNDFGLPLGADIDALDMPMSLYQLGVAAIPDLSLPDPARGPSIFFSVEGSVANLCRVPNSWWGTTTKSGAVVFEAYWLPSTSSWSCPTVHYRPSDLNLADSEDIDAIAYDYYDSRRPLVFSTRAGATSQPSQLMVYVASCDAAAPVPLLDINGDRITDSLGIRINSLDDVDAVCLEDPVCTGVRASGGNAAWIERVLASPNTTNAVPFPRLLELQVHRVPGPTYSFDTWVVGGPPDGLCLLLFGFATSWPVPAGYIVFDLPLLSAFAGNPARFSFGLPRVAPPGLDIVVQAVTVARAFTGGQGTASLRRSHPVTIQLR